MVDPAEHTYDLIVIGGGPAGSCAATLAAKAGLSVLLLEAAEHPRVHVGESFLPGIIPILEEMGALPEVEAAGFGIKTGTTHKKWGRTPEWDLWFWETDLYDHAWLVDRARFDEILLRAAVRAGAEVRQSSPVTELIWDAERLSGARFRHRGERGVRTARAPFTIDASGQSALVARQLELRTMIDGLQHQALWAHFENAGCQAPPRQNQALFVAEAGYWLWLFPFREGRASVGVVRLDDAGAAAARDVESVFEKCVESSAELKEVLGQSARRVTPVRRERDWSYRMSRVSGPGWLLAGDASGFIDPVLSTGVFLALHAGWHAARTVTSIRRGTSDEASALAAYQTHHQTLFTDLLRMVRFYYQQNLFLEDYFWESKRILMREETELRPQKAFLILTSGLVQNLALDEKQTVVDERRNREAMSGTAESLEVHDPEKLGFVCIHLRFTQGPERAALYFLIEPLDPGTPTLFRTLNWHLNCLAPRFDNDPISVPALAPHLRSLESQIKKLDCVAGEPLVQFWRRSRSELMRALQALPRDFEIVRVFGE